MDSNLVPQNLEEVQNQITLMKERGFDITEDDVIRQSLLLGLQNLIDIRTDGHYYTVHWTSDDQFEVRGIGAVVEGTIKPNTDLSFVGQFKNNSELLWDDLGNQASKIVGR